MTVDDSVDRKARADQLVRPRLLTVALGLAFSWEASAHAQYLPPSPQPPPGAAGPEFPQPQFLPAQQPVFTQQQVFAQQPSPPAEPLPEPWSSERIEPLPQPGGRGELVPNPTQVPYAPPAPIETPLAEPPPDAVTAPTPASPGKGRGSGGPPGGFGPKFQYRASWLPDRPITSQLGDLGLWQQEAAVSSPLGMTKFGLVTGSVSIQHNQFQTDTILPTSGQPFPESLYAIRFGTGLMKKFDNDWMAMVNINVDSNSDDPFGSFDDVTIGTMAFLRIPRGQNAWNFALIYSPMSEIPFPIPGVSYQWVPNDRWKASIGLPFQLTYTPSEHWEFDFRYIPVRNVQARAAWQFLPAAKLYSSYTYNNQRFFLSDRTNDDDRFWSYDQRLTSGIEWIIADKWTVDASVAYVFDRFYFQGDGFEDRNRDRVDVDSGAAISIQLERRFGSGRPGAK